MGFSNGINDPTFKNKQIKRDNRLLNVLFSYAIDFFANQHEDYFVSTCSWWATDSPNYLRSKAVYQCDSHHIIPRGNFVVL